MNQYLLSVYEVEGQGEGTPPTPEEMQAFMGRVIALEEEMDRAGAFVFGGALHGPDATTVVRGGTGLDKVTTDGPFVEAKEHIGGFYIINAEDLDEALAWAAQGRRGDQPRHRGAAVPGDRARCRLARPLTEPVAWTTSSGRSARRTARRWRR